MIEENEAYFDERDFSHFRNWINLNIDAVTWQGQYLQEFEEFWSIFFLEGQSLKQLSDRFDYAILHSKIGPLSSWFNWVRHKLITFSFLNKEATIFSLSEQTGMRIGKVAVILRDFFLERNPHLEVEISDLFQVSHLCDDNLLLKYDELIKLVELDEGEEITHDDVMTSMEVTLYPEWRVLTEKMKSDLYHPHFDFDKIKSKMSLKNQFRFLREVFLLFILGLLAIYAVKEVNQWWSKKLIDKISVYDPQLKWLDKTLSFKEEVSPDDDKFKLVPSNLDEVEKVENKLENISDSDDVRYETESEVVLTSWDSLPKDFDAVDLEQSDYEELKKRGYRDSRYGLTKVYRVMMKSEDTLESKSSLIKLINKYQVTRVDNVRPGKEVPGGVYYNLFVPRVFLKEFMAQVMDVGDAVLYESRTRAGRNPPGKNKVFIWIKNI